MTSIIRTQRWPQLLFYALFGLASFALLWWYLSDTLIHFTTPQQFPISSIERLPLTLLIFPAELFSLLFALYFVYTLFTDYRPPKPKSLPDKKHVPVGILIPVYHEPKEVVERTLKACRNLKWPGKISIYLGIDGKDPQSIKDMKDLARKYRCVPIERPDRVGYKAGNVNNVVSNYIKEDFFAIFDSDQAPEPEFFEAMMDYFTDQKVGYVQAPQYFVNDNTPLTRGAKLGANIFFQAMCASRSKDKAMVFCGTNVIFRKSAFEKVGGLSYYTATEDIELGLRINEAGYYGQYVAKVLVKGYAPEDWTAYASQQYRWANGNLAILRESFKHILGGPFSLMQQIHYLFVLAWWLIGFVTLAYVIVPLFSLFLGMGTHHTWLPTAVIILLYFNVALGIGMIYMALKNRIDDDKVTIKDAFIQYSLITNSMFIYARAALNVIFKRYIGFVRTNKGRLSTGVMQIKWNLLLALITFSASIYAVYNAAIAVDALGVRTYLPLSIWLLFYTIILASSIFFVGGNEEEDLHGNTGELSGVSA